MLSPLEAEARCVRHQARASCLMALFSFLISATLGLRRAPRALAMPEKERYVPKSAARRRDHGGFEIIVTYPIEREGAQQLLYQAPCAAAPGPPPRTCTASPAASALDRREARRAGWPRALAVALLRFPPRRPCTSGRPPLLATARRGRRARRRVSPLNSMLAGTLAGTAEGIFVVTPMQNITIKWSRNGAQARARENRRAKRRAAARGREAEAALNRLSLLALSAPARARPQVHDANGPQRMRGLARVYTRASRASSAASSAARPRPCSRAP